MITRPPPPLATPLNPSTIRLQSNSSSSSSSRRRRRRWQVMGGTHNGRKANLQAGRKERVMLPDYTDDGRRSFAIGEFLSHRSGVEALLNTRALQSFHSLDPNTYRCTLHTIQFLKFEVAPVLDLRVIPTNEDCTVEMLSCKFVGSEMLERQNQLFSAFMTNHIKWDVNGSEPCLEMDVNLKITLEVYTKPFSMLPISVVEKPGNLVMQGLLDRLVPLLVEQLLDDYRIWVEQQLQLLSDP